MYVRPMPVKELTSGWIRNPCRGALNAAGTCAAQPEIICPLVVLLLINQDAATLATRIEAHMVGKLSFCSCAPLQSPLQSLDQKQA